MQSKDASGCIAKSKNSFDLNDAHWCACWSAQVSLLTKLFVTDGSKRSAHSDASMFGFGNNRRIVLFDIPPDIREGG